MVSKHHIIYLPGIGDHKPYFQPQIINLWRIFGVTPHYHPVIWRGDENFDAKLNRLTKLIDELYAEGNLVSLVGVSAGATAAFNAYMQRPEKISKVVYICGKLRRPETVGRYYYQTNMAFIQSLKKVQPQISKLAPFDTVKMLSLRPIYDQTVPTADMVLPGVKKLRMLSVYHIPSIFTGLIFYAPTICMFIRKKV